MLQPKRTKYYERYKSKMKNSRGHELSNGMFGIKSVHEDGCCFCQTWKRHVAWKMGRGKLLETLRYSIDGKKVVEYWARC
jgi:hypothetical protein